jgi:hypothetical protein
MAVSIPKNIQALGQLPSLDEIGEQIAALALRAAEARRTVLKCELEIAKLLSLLTEQHGLKGRAFSGFALEHGVGSRTDAYDMVKVADDADAIIAKHETATRDDPLHEWPSWRQVWSDIKQQTRTRYWLTPDDVYQPLNDEFRFDYDPCPYPRPDGFDSLAEDVEWGESNYANVPFRQGDAVGGRGITAFVRKGIAQRRKDKTIVFMLPVHDYVTLLLKEGAEMRPLGRMKFLDVDTREPAKHASNVCLFILRPHSPAARDEFDAIKQSATASVHAGRHCSVTLFRCGTM